MAANYPGSLPVKNAAGANLSTDPHSTLHDGMYDEIVAIATELGTTPKGTYATVKARLDAESRRVGAHVTRATAQAFNATTLTDVTYTAETQDTDGFFAPTSSTLTVPTGLGGVYAVTFNCTLSVSPTLSLYLYQNSSIIGQGAGSAAGTGVITMIVALAAGDTVKAAIYGSSGGNINSAELRLYRMSL